MFKQKETLIILWLTFITVVVWIATTIYHISVTSTIADTDASAIVPIDPRFDTITINKLKTRKIIDPVYQFSESSDEDTASPSAQIPVPEVSGEP